MDGVMLKNVESGELLLRKIYNGIVLLVERALRVP